jgi:hypothetical protein
MYRIAFFDKYITNFDGRSYATYQTICKYLDTKPIIFSDVSNINIPNNIPLFNSYYLRQLYNLFYIVTDISNMNYMDPTINAKIIAIYDELVEKPTVLTNNVVYYDINTNLKEFIQENILCNMTN